MADDDRGRGSPGSYRSTDVAEEDPRVLLSTGVSDAVREKLTEPPPVPTEVDDRAGAIILEMRLCGPGDEGPYVRRLVALGPGAIPVIARNFPGSRWFDRHAAHVQPPRGRQVSGLGAALVAFGDAAVEWVAALLEAHHPEIRYYAALVSADLAHPALVPALGRLVFDGDEGVRDAALRALGGLRSADGFSVLCATLAGAASNPATHRVYRRRAVRALGRLRDVRSTSLLIELLDDADEDVAEAAREALTTLTGRDRGAVRVRWSEWWTAHRGEDRTEWLLSALASDEPSARLRSIAELRRMGPCDLPFDAHAPEEERREMVAAWRAHFEDADGDPES